MHAEISGVGHHTLTALRLLVDIQSTRLALTRLLGRRRRQPDRAAPCLAFRMPPKALTEHPSVRARCRIGAQLRTVSPCQQRAVDSDLGVIAVLQERKYMQSLPSGIL
jgi:hypothetical protein